MLQKYIFVECMSLFVILIISSRIIISLLGTAENVM